jgi:hypothetical protein
VEKNIKKQIKALEVVEEIISSRCQMIDHLYSGDKDTRIEAFTNILVKNGLPSFYDLSKDEIKEYSNTYSLEIDEEYDRLCQFGSTEFKDANICWGYIKKLLNEYHSV